LFHDYMVLRLYGYYEIRKCRIKCYVFKCKRVVQNVTYLSARMPCKVSRVHIYICRIINSNELYFIFFSRVSATNSNNMSEGGNSSSDGGATLGWIIYYFSLIYIARVFILIYVIRLLNNLNKNEVRILLYDISLKHNNFLSEYIRIEKSIRAIIIFLNISYFERCCM